jgi:N-acyl-D-amino-acid deacylase
MTFSLRFSRGSIAALALLLAAQLLTTVSASRSGFDSAVGSQESTTAQATLIAGGRIIDGSGKPPFRADIRIAGDQIAAIGRLRPEPGDRVLQADGMIVAPGFIDIHNHSEAGLVSEPAATTQVSQGITTLAVGPDGGSPWPVGDYLRQREQQKTAVNLLSFVGHATVRQQVMGSDYARTATADEISRMAKLVEQAMAEGAFGLSSGLEYDVGRSATTQELIELARAASRHRGIYMTHMRDEEEGMIDAVREALRIGKEARLPVQISHIKMGNRNVWGKSARVISLINGARKGGADVTADCYPYTAWASTITILIPSRRHDDRQEVEKGLKNVGGPANVLITNCKAHLDFEGKTLEEIAQSINKSPAEAYQLIVRDGGASIVCNSMNEADVRAFYKQRWVMVSSDGGIGSRHPRGAGTFTKVLSDFSRRQRWFSMEEAIRKMTSAPARRLGLPDRGLIRVGNKADLVVFDPAAVKDRSTFKEPMLLSVGVRLVVVNGRPVWKDGRVTGELPGVVIRNAEKVSN